MKNVKVQLKSKNYTDGFSFVLRPSTLPEAGIGVFLLHDVASGTYMELFLEDFEEVLYEKSEVPLALEGYCLDQSDGKILCPKHFNRLDIGNYLNHSKKHKNLRYNKGSGYFTIRNLKEGEELFADYNDLDEPDSTKPDYYEN